MLLMNNSGIFLGVFHTAIAEDVATVLMFQPLIHLFLDS